MNPDGGSVGLGPAAARNVLKIAVPWQLGHVVAVGAAFGGFDRPDPGLVVASVATYAVMSVGLWGVLRRSEVTVHDLAAGTRVFSRDV